MFFGPRQRLQGVVTNVGAPAALARPRWTAGRILLAGLLLLAAPVILLSLAVVRAMGGQRQSRHRPSFTSELWRRVAGDYIAARFAAGTGPRHIQDLRIIDSAGQQHAARVDGTLLPGSVTPGDRVDLGGKWDGRVFVIRSGRNLVTGADLQIVT